MKSWTLLFSVLIGTGLQAQYYFNDIVSTREVAQQMKAYTENNVKRVVATGFTPQGQPTSEFSEVHEIVENGRVLRITSRNPSLTITTYRFDEKGNLAVATDSSEAVVSRTTYQYDALGNLVGVQNSIRDSANDFNQLENHAWFYDASGKPTRMWRTINGSDSLEVRFTPDESGNPGDERSYRRGLETGVVYYYFDDRNRLTDIVRYNKKARRLLPDYMFEYDDQDRVIQKITTTTSLDLGYLIWRFVFNERGLKTKEALFSKDKQMTGKIEYAYSF
ncbi:MAG TPA: hypothetical protein VEB63_00015 [Chitinophagaceae bacterium]|nr:hypothetical protein [Chitinophagaceae bacterium]